MSQAVMEPEVQKYQMPLPRIGQDVDWFPMGDKARARRAVVRRIYQEKIELLDTVGGAAPIKVCFHCDNPVVLEKTMDFSHDGTWDFTVEEKDMKRWKATVENDILNLSKRLEALESARPQKSTKGE
jgi:hypothetical protein